jgi:hypothetical protein
MDEMKRSRRIRILFWLSLAASGSCSIAMNVCNPTTIPMEGDVPWLFGFLGFAFVSGIAAQ